MLVIKRKVGESILLGEDIEIVVSEVIGDKVKIAIDAPKEVKIMRRELKDTSDFNRTAISAVGIANLKELNKRIKK